MRWVIANFVHADGEPPHLPDLGAAILDSNNDATMRQALCLVDTDSAPEGTEDVTDAVLDPKQRAWLSPNFSLPIFWDPEALAAQRLELRDQEAEQARADEQARAKAETDAAAEAQAAVEPSASQPDQEHIPASVREHAEDGEGETAAEPSPASPETDQESA